MATRTDTVSTSLHGANTVVIIVVAGTIASFALAAIQILEPAPGGGAFLGVVCSTLALTALLALWGPALAQSRGRLQSDRARHALRELPARKLRRAELDSPFGWVTSTKLSVGDVVLVKETESIPSDGDVVNGVALVDESAVTGESAPVIRESGGDRASVIGGTRVLSDWLMVRITAARNQSFLDRIAHAAKGVSRRMTRSESTLVARLTLLSLVLLGATALVFSRRMDALAPIAGEAGSVLAFVALLLAMVPSVSGTLIAPIAVGGMKELAGLNVLALSGAAVEAAGEVDVVVLDKTGTITRGSREVSGLEPASGVSEADLAEAAQLASLADGTPEGRSVVLFAKRRFGLRGRSLKELQGELVPFDAATRMSGIDMPGRRIRKGAAEAIRRYVEESGGTLPTALAARVDLCASSGGTPLLVTENARILGLIELRDALKPGLRDRLAELRGLGIRTFLSTGDGASTAASVTGEAGIDGFLAEATAEAKLGLIRREQADGHRVAMVGDGTNDAPALAQADLAVAMGTGSRLAREAANMVDLDSDPTKLAAIIGVGRRVASRRRELLGLALGADIGKVLVLGSGIAALVFPGRSFPNPLALGSAPGAILAGLLFNAFAAAAVLALARFDRRARRPLLRRDSRPWVAAAIGLASPWVAIKLADLLLEWALR
jgi:potassium-transporting ATPase ATP-binding subunit